MTPYYDLCPSTPVENLRWRLAIREAAKDKLLRADIRQACEEDPLFFFTFAAWLIEPRGEFKVIPFVLWPHQVDAILTLVKSVREATTEDPITVLFDKSRGQGATWICLYVILWFWLFEPMFAAGIISRSIEAVDKKNYPGSLFPKLDWAISMLPFWLRPKGFSASKDRSQTDHVWHNRENGAVIVGTACTAEAFSGDRLSLVLYDEAAKVEHQDFEDGINSIQHVTNTRWVVSTHVGDSGPFYDMIFGTSWQQAGEVKSMGGSGVYVSPSGSFKCILDWRDNPSQNRLAYRYTGGSFCPERPEEAKKVRDYVQRIKESGAWQRLVRKQFVKDGQLRSPWYDKKCLADGATPRSIAQDVGRDPRSTVGKMFNPEVLDEMDKKQVRPPLWRGDVILRDSKVHFVESVDGPLKLWFKLGLGDEPPKGRFVLGGDIGSGIQGAETSNSVLSGGDASTGEQILEYVNQLPESRFADMAVALAEWLGDALLIWEAQGPYGKRFAIRVVNEIGYWNIWRRPNAPLRGTPRNRANSEQLGWVNNKPVHKVDLFEDYWLAMQDDEYFPRSVELILECRGWEEVPTKTPGKNEIVYHGTGHGDRVVAGGLAWKAMKEIARFSIDKPKKRDKDDIIDAEVSDFGMAGRYARMRARAGRDDEDDDLAGFRREPVGILR